MVLPIFVVVMWIVGYQEKYIVYGSQMVNSPLNYGFQLVCRYLRRIEGCEAFVLTR